MNRPSRWSYSDHSTWQECSAKYSYSYIYKLPWPESPQMMRGSRLHKLAEDYINEPAMPVPYDLKKIGRIIDDFRNKGAKAEETWLIDADWLYTEDIGKAKCKAIIDLHYIDGDVLHVVDYKSGREYPSHRDQLELYSILGLLKYPQAKRAESAAVYIDGGYTGMESSIIRPMLPIVIQSWREQAQSMEADQDFIAKPGSACRWCPYAKSAGGPCQESAKAGF